MKLHFAALLVCLTCYMSTHMAGAVDDKCVPSSEGLVAWWRGDDTAQNINPDTAPDLVNVEFSEGKVGKAMQFNSAGTYVRIPKSSKLDVGASSGFTVEFWVNPRENHSGQPLFEWNNQQKWGVHLWIYGAPGQLMANIADTAGAQHGLSTGPGIMRAGQWQHVALTYDKNGMASIYRNGVLMAQQDLGSFTPQTTYDLFLSVRPAGAERGAFLKGALDEISIYDKALTQKQIQAVYEAGSAGKCVG